MKAFKITSVAAIAGILLLLPVFLSAQIHVEKQLFVEVKDTIEIAYNHYYIDNWVTHNGFSMSREIQKDSIGIDSIRITRMFYLEEVPHKNNNPMYIQFYTTRKIYLELIFSKKYLSKRKGNDFPKEYAN